MKILSTSDVEAKWAAFLIPSNPQLVPLVQEINLIIVPEKPLSEAKITLLFEAVIRAPEENPLVKLVIEGIVYNGVEILGELRRRLGLINEASASLPVRDGEAKSPEVNAGISSHDAISASPPSTPKSATLKGWNVYPGVMGYPEYLEWSMKQQGALTTEQRQRMRSNGTHNSPLSQVPCIASLKKIMAEREKSPFANPPTPKVDRPKPPFSYQSPFKPFDIPPEVQKAINTEYYSSGIGPNDENSRYNSNVQKQESDSIDDNTDTADAVSQISNSKI